MKKITIIALMILSIENVLSQNLVLNPGLDQYITCPGFGQFSNTYITSWDKPSIASSDYYNLNCAGIQPTVQTCRSGEGYAGIICYNFGTEYREYITGMFASPLIAGTSYDVEFYVSLHDGYIQAIQEIGAYISVAAPGPFSNVLHINVTPQIENTSGAIIDTIGWKQINGQFTASGGEQFITIGNFHDDAGTTITQPGTFGSYGAYYFVEDVSVTEIGATSLNTINTNSGISVSVNPGNIVNIHVPENILLNNTNVYYCYDLSGKCISSSKLNEKENLINLSKFSEGVYLVSISNEKGIAAKAKIFLTGK